MEKMERVLLSTLLILFSNYLLSSVIYSRELFDIDDNILHLANHKIIWENGGKDPFNGLTKYPTLFYYIPFNVIFTEYAFICLILPISLYFFAGLYIKEKIKRAMVPIMWLFLAASMPHWLYGQIIGMFFVGIFAFFWIKQNYLIAFLVIIPVFFGHNGTILLIFPMSIWAFLCLFTKDKYLKLMLLELAIFPSVFLNNRGWYILNYFGSVPLVSFLFENKKKQYFIIMFLMFFAHFRTIHQVAYYTGDKDLTFNTRLSFHRYNGSYCFYPPIESLGKRRYASSETVILGWVKYDIPVKQCNLDAFLDSREKTFQFIFERMKARTRW